MISTLKEVREALNSALNESDTQLAEYALTKLDALIAATEKAEPVDEVRAKSDAYGGTFVHWKKLPVAGMVLYAAPQTAPSTAETPIAQWLECGAPESFRTVTERDMEIALRYFAEPHVPETNFGNIKPLTPQQLAQFHRDAYVQCKEFTTIATYTAFARAIEAAHGIGAKP